MSHTVRRLGIGLGSFVAAWLVVWLVGGALLGSSTVWGPVGWFAAAVLGGFVYSDIIRREGHRGPR